MRLVIDQQASINDPSILNCLETLVAEDVAFFRSSYPHFDEWLKTRVLPGISKGERTICLEMIGAKVAGLMILKHAPRERKICTLRVRPEFENSGLGIRLFKDAFERLDTGLPLLSVSDAVLPKFKRVFEYFGFHKEGVYRGLYLPNTVEHSFNGVLAQPKVVELA